MKAQLTILNLGEAKTWFPVLIEWWKFIAEMTKALAWPFVVLWLVKTFRIPLLDLLGQLAERLESAEGAGIKLGFTAKVAKLQETARAIAENNQQAARPEQPPEVGQEHAPGPSPVRRGPLGTQNQDNLIIGTILGSWQSIENTLRAAWYPLAPWKMKGAPSVGRIISDLASAGAISPEIADLVIRARELRNVVAHNGVGMITMSDAEAYRDTAESILRALQQSED